MHRRNGERMHVGSVFLGKKHSLGLAKKEQELKAEISWKKDVKASFNHLPSNLGVCVCFLFKLLQEYVDGVVMFPEKNSVL